MPYQILRVVEATEVPDWERKAPKWEEIAEAVMDLQPNQSLEIQFDDDKEANRARNAVRDSVNLKANAIVVRTRVVRADDAKKGTKVYFIRLREPETKEAA